MKHIKSFAAILSVAFLIGCATSQVATTYKTLASIQTTTSGAYNAYLDLVVKGQVSTNSVPTISRDYTIYQNVWNTAVAVAASGVLTPAPQTVLDASALVITDINKAKGTP